MTLTLTNEEANALANLLDIAVKSAGIRSAGAALLILKKLEEAARSPDVENTNGD